MRNKALSLRRTVFKTAVKAGKGHIPPAFSWVDIAVVLGRVDVALYFVSPEFAERRTCRGALACVLGYQAIHAIPKVSISHNIN